VSAARHSSVCRQCQNRPGLSKHSYLTRRFGESCAYRRVQIAPRHDVTLCPSLASPSRFALGSFISTIKRPRKCGGRPSAGGGVMPHRLVGAQTDGGDPSWEEGAVVRFRMVPDVRQVVAMLAEHFRILGSERRGSSRTCRILVNRHRRWHWLASSQVDRRRWVSDVRWGCRSSRRSFPCRLRRRSHCRPFLK